MNATLRRYPRFLFQLCLLLLVQGVAQQSLHNSKTLGAVEAAAQSGESLPFLYQFPISALMLILAGWIVDRIKNVRYGMQVSLAVMLLGSVVASMNNPYLGFWGTALVSGGSAVVYLLALLHLAVWYPVANGEKDNAFMMLALPPLFVGLIAGLALPLLALFQSTYTDLAFIALCLLVGYFIVNGSRDIGFEVVSSDEEEPAQPLRWGILWGFTAFSAAIHLASVYLREIGEGSTSFFLEGVEPYFINFLIYLLLLFFILGFVWSLLRSPSPAPSQIRKVQAGMFALLGIAVLEFGVMASGSFELDILSNALPHFIHDYLLLSVLLSALTHVNFDRHAGLWLGICIGVPELVSSILSNLVSPHTPLWVLPVLSATLLILGIIWLRENEAFVRDTLRLEEPNQEVEEEDEEGGDPLDHLVEPS